MCTDADGNGICDSPYNIPGGSSVDRYPLVSWSTPPSAQYVTSCDSNGPENTFNPNEDVYCYGGNLPLNDVVDIYIVVDKAWAVGDSIGTDISDDGVNAVSTDNSGNILTAKIWTAPLTLGEYDIVFDLDQDGELDANDPVDDFTFSEGVEVVPEFTTIALPVAAVFVLLFILRRKK